jgi:tRNA U34 5-methylaminomethyl-2-thiouridine-forming methyltransferase MnmC
LFQLITTSDGSHSVLDTQTGVTYHSKHGAIQESRHIFVQAGLMHLTPKQQLSVLEVGFGTGLNALLTRLAAESHIMDFYYEAIENKPLDVTEYSGLNYCEILKRPDLAESFQQLHLLPWNVPTEWIPGFVINKRKEDLQQASLKGPFHLVYFDAFDPVVQPELWTTDVFQMIRTNMYEHGVLVTYSSKSSVQRALRSSGFEVTKLAGPPGKREIVRATAN